MATRFYRWLVRVHPRQFRERFGAEMLCVYDEAGLGERPMLFVDSAISLVRQWVVRSRYWIAGAAVAGAVLQFVIAGTAWLGASRRALTAWISTGENQPEQGAVLLLGAGLVCAVLLLATTLASLVHGTARRKSSGER
jgi:hypothetical protein